MTTTYTWLGIPADPATKVASVPEIDSSDIRVVGPIFDKAGNTIGTEYVLESSLLPEETVRIEVKSVHDPKTDILRSSLRMYVVVHTEVDLGTTESERWDPAEIIIAWNTRGAYVSDTAQLVRAIGSAFSLVCNSFDGSTGVPETTNLDAMNFGRTSGFWGV